MNESSKTIRLIMVDLMGVSDIGLRDALVFASTFLIAKWAITVRRTRYPAIVDHNKNILISKTSREKFLPLPPSPPRLPFVGNLFRLRTDMREVFRSISEELGGVFALHLGPKMVVVISDLDAMKEAFLNQGDAFADRAAPGFLKYAIGIKGSFVFENGEAWKARRRFGLKAMRSFGVGKTSMEQRILEEARILCECFENNQGIDFVPTRSISNAVANVICSISFGSRYDYDDPRFAKVIVPVHSAVSDISFFSLGNFIPVLFDTPLYSEFRRLVYAIKSLVQDIVNAHRRTLDQNHARDIIDLYIMEIRRQKESGEKVVFEDERAWRTIFDLFIAGTGTTSVTLLWAIFLMTKFPDVMARVQSEIDSVIGDHRLPAMADKESMPFTMATIMEVQRFRPAVPLGVPRFTNRDVDVLGYRITKGTRVFMPLWSVLHSPKYWKDAEVFNPTRFLSEDGKTVLKPDAFIPFGMGHRVCMGELLAKMELFLFFTTLLQRFTFRLADGYEDSGLEGKAGIVLNPPAFKIRVSTR